jgi:hypothetical protein
MDFSEIVQELSGISLDNTPLNIVRKSGDESGHVQSQAAEIDNLPTDAEGELRVALARDVAGDGDEQAG